MWKKRLSVDILSCPIPVRPYPPPANHLASHGPPPRDFYNHMPGRNTTLCFVCVRILYVGGWRVPEWLSHKIFKDAHGKLSARAKPQSFSVISADFSFFSTIHETGDCHRWYSLWFYSSSSELPFFWPSLLELHFAYKCTAEPIRGFLCNLRVGKMFPLPPTVVSKVWMLTHGSSKEQADGC